MTNVRDSQMKPLGSSASDWIGDRRYVFRHENLMKAECHPMNQERISRLKTAIQRLRAGDQNAAHDVVVLALGSFRHEFSNLRKCFSRLKGHDTDSVFNSAWPQLDRHIRAKPPQSVEDLLRLTCTIIRNDLIDLARRESAPFRNALHLDGEVDPASAAPGAEELSSWAEFHEAVGRLPDDERHVFELHYYLETTQADIAHLLVLHPRQVSRLYARAVGRLAAWMGDGGFLD